MKPPLHKISDPEQVRRDLKSLYKSKKLKSKTKFPKEKYHLRYHKSPINIQNNEKFDSEPESEVEGPTISEKDGKYFLINSIDFKLTYVRPDSSQGLEFDQEYIF